MALLYVLLVPVVLVYCIWSVGNAFAPKQSSQASYKPIATMQVGSPNELPKRFSETKVVEIEKSPVIPKQQEFKIKIGEGIFLDLTGGLLLAFNVWAWLSLVSYRITKKKNIYIRLIERGLISVRYLVRFVVGRSGRRSAVPHI